MRSKFGLGLRGLLLGLALSASLAAQAHLMVAQRGTLNIVGDAAYMVLSLPVSALRQVDDDGDARLSLAEGNAHLHEIEAQVRAGLQLQSDQGPMPLDGLMVNLSPPDDAPTAPARHIVVLGRFSAQPHSSHWRLSLQLFGHREDESTQHITVTRGSETQLITLSPAHPAMDVLPSASVLLLEQTRLGFVHILAGADHLLFLLLVLSAGLRFRHIVLALTSFTAGHALTLIACAWWGWKVAPAVVEPAIAATLIAMACFDRWALRRSHPVSPALRLVLVFACALIHGLGLAEALADLGLSVSHKVLSLAGFNLGIELGQLSVAILALGAAHTLRRWLHPSTLQRSQTWLSALALALGVGWFLQRVMVVG